MNTVREFNTMDLRFVPDSGSSGVERNPKRLGLGGDDGARVNLRDDELRDRSGTNDI